jgi:tRNA 2-thiouridine synthesizing protein C
VEKLYVERQSLEERGLKEEDLVVPVEIMEAEEIGCLMQEQEAVFHH